MIVYKDIFSWMWKALINHVRHIYPHGTFCIVFPTYIYFFLIHFFYLVIQQVVLLPVLHSYSINFHYLIKYNFQVKSPANLSWTFTSLSNSKTIFLHHCFRQIREGSSWWLKYGHGIWFIISDSTSSQSCDWQAPMSSIPLNYDKIHLLYDDCKH